MDRTPLRPLPLSLSLSLSPFLSLFVCTCVRVCVWLPNGPAKGTKRKIVLYWCVLQIMTNRTNQKETNNRIKLTKRNDCFILTSKGYYCMDLSSAMPQPSSIDHLDWSLECRQRKPTATSFFSWLHVNDVSWIPVERQRERSSTRKGSGSQQRP